jgi:hypothetical protein
MCCDCPMRTCQLLAFAQRHSFDTKHNWISVLELPMQSGYARLGVIGLVMDWINGVQTSEVCCTLVGFYCIEWCLIHTVWHCTLRDDYTEQCISGSVIYIELHPFDAFGHLDCCIDRYVTTRGASFNMVMHWSSSSRIFYCINICVIVWYITYN